MIAIIFPFAFERKCFIGGEPLWREENHLGLSVLTHPKYAWLLVVGGQGKAETALSCQMLLGKYSIDFFILMGAATALNPELKLGEMILSNQISLNHGELNFNTLQDSNKKTPLLILARNNTSSVVDLGRF